MPATETYSYKGITYTWHHETQNEYYNRHISIPSAVATIESCSNPELQSVNSEERWKHIGLCDSGIITVITDDTFTKIITAWHSSSDEVKTWLSWN